MFGGSRDVPLDASECDMWFAASRDLLSWCDAMCRAMRCVSCDVLWRAGTLDVMSWCATRCDT
jgi:hypothetical protein